MRRAPSHQRFIIATLATLALASATAACGASTSETTHADPVALDQANEPKARGAAPIGDAEGRAEAEPEATADAEKPRLPQTYEELKDILICPCPGLEATPLGQCLDNQEVCRDALLAADTLEFHMSIGRPAEVAVDQALKDLYAAQSHQTFNVEERPRLGSIDAPIQLVAFEDFQCPYCRRTAEALHDVVETYGDRVSLVFKHYPLGRHEFAREAALAAAAARVQGKFWPLHDALFEHQTELNDARIMEIAAGLGIDIEKLARDMKSDAIIAIVDGDLSDGDQADLSGTPSVFINGRDIGDDMSTERLARRIDFELAWLDREAGDPTASQQSGRTWIVAQAGGAPGKAAKKFAAVADLFSLLDADQQARFERIADAEICPCSGKSGFQSLSKCLDTSEGTCQLATRIATMSMRGIMEGDTDSAITDKIIQEVEAAKTVYKFEYDPVAHKGADPDKAKVVIVEFADFKCGYCKKAAKITKEIAETYEGDVAIYFKNYPLNPQSISPLAAAASYAAGEQGQFWAMHDLMFEHQSDLDEKKILAIAEQLGMNIEKFATDVASDAVQKKVRRDRAEGEAAKVQGTPAFFINGVRFMGSHDEIEAAVKDRLAE